MEEIKSAVAGILLNRYGSESLRSIYKKLSEYSPEEIDQALKEMSEEGAICLYRGMAQSRFGHQYHPINFKYVTRPLDIIDDKFVFGIDLPL